MHSLFNYFVEFLLEFLLWEEASEVLFLELFLELLPASSDALFWLWFL